MENSEEIIDSIEEEQEVEKPKKKTYKVNLGDTIVVRRTDVETEGKIFSFYYTTVAKKEYGSTKYYKKILKFKKGISLKDKTTIKINDMFEDAMMNKKDRYNAIWCLVILDFEIIMENDNNSQQAILDYQQNISENKEENDMYNFITF